MTEPTKFDPSNKPVFEKEKKIRNYQINLNSTHFSDVVNKLIIENNIEDIIETGTFNGLGSTTIFAQTKKNVFSIECNYQNYSTALKNLSRYENVCLIHGLSTDKYETMRFIMQNNYNEDIQYDSQYPKPFYMREVVQYNVLDNVLINLIKNTKNQLIFLDSAGGLGEWELLKVFDIDEYFLQSKVLLLDDVDHIKHKNSVKILNDKGYRVHISDDGRFAWCIIKNNY